MGGSLDNYLKQNPIDRAGAAQFTRFLKEKGLSRRSSSHDWTIWADHVDWLVLPADLRKEIMSWDRVFDIDTTRSFPHSWEFKGKKGIGWKKVSVRWTGPPQEFYNKYKKN